MSLLEKSVLGRTMRYRAEAMDGKGGNWDLRIIEEVIDSDAYNLRSIREASVVVDVGGHIGSFVLMAKHLWPQATVLTFEPLFDNFDLLIQNIEGMQGVQPHNKALIGSRQATIGFRVPNLFNPETASKNSGDGRVDQDGDFVVQADRLNNYLQSYMVDVLKLDCEGSEGHIVQALSVEEKKRIRHIVGEFHGAGMDEILYASLVGTHDFKVTKQPFTDLGNFEAHLRA